ncbi:hypothetical protein HDE68_003483 [Pedobacter cryoconitis]|uniref:Uncharacterized protein n=1 Tax=Pedobacter cryoconitis TaxID=188932 RepID=A0A7W9E015_9SPHI|nr:hypothetical protein [Pedobacter cryoconitis]MBB5637568.1 hypothetical protein [Pedobacter cryoconitis]
MNIKRLIVKPLLSLLLITNTIHADAQYFKLKKVQDPAGMFGDLDFPVLTGKTVAENKINTFLQGKELDLLPGKQKTSLFENIKPKKGSNTGTTLMNYTLLVNSSKLFSIQINSEYSNGSLSDNSNTYNFDSQTGKLIKFSDLLTKEGYDAVRKFIIDSRKTRLAIHLKKLKSSANKDQGDADNYSGCLIEQNKDNLDADDLLFQKNGLLLTRRSCLGSHNAQALEADIRIYDNLLSNQFLQPYLNEYGKCLLSAANSKCIQSQAAGLSRGVFKGKINDLYPITLLITSIGNESFSASYFYDQQGKKIFLKGTFDKDSSWLLKEIASSSQQKNQELFKLSLQKDGSLTGNWSNGKNTFSVKLIQ